MSDSIMLDKAKDFAVDIVNLCRQISFEKKEGWHLYECKGMNMIRSGEEIEFVSPDFCSLKVPAAEWEIIDSETGLKMNWTCDGHPTVIYLKYQLPQGTLLRTLDPDYEEGKIRDTGR